MYLLFCSCFCFCNGALSYSEAVCVVFRVILLPVTDLVPMHVWSPMHAYRSQLAECIICKTSACSFVSVVLCQSSDLGSGFVHGGNLKPGCVPSVSCTETTWNILGYEGFFGCFFFQLWATCKQTTWTQTHICFHLTLFFEEQRMWTLALQNWCDKCLIRSTLTLISGNSVWWFWQQTIICTFTTHTPTEIKRALSLLLWRLASNKMLSVFILFFFLIIIPCAVPVSQRGTACTRNSSSETHLLWMWNYEEYLIRCCHACSK